MKSISDDAEEHNVVPTAKLSSDVTAPAESAYQPESISDGSGDNTSKCHGFSKTVAEHKNAKGEILGYNAAIILRYLAHAVRKHGKRFEGKRFVRVNLDHITAQYPYMGRSTVDENVLRLQAFGCCEIENHNQDLFLRPKYDRTRCYHVPKKWMDAAEDVPRYFDANLAAKLGVPAAVVHYNFCHWIEEWKAKKLKQRVKLAPALLNQLLPFGKPTIKRAIRSLVQNGLIVGVPGMPCWYAVGKGEMGGGAKADEGGAKADEGGAKADEGGAKADNDKYCNNIIDSLEKNSKEHKPPACDFELPSSDMNKGHDAIRSSHEGIAPIPGEQHGEAKMRDKAISPFANPICFSHHKDKDDVLAPSTCDISGEAEDVAGECPSEFTSFGDVQDYNRRLDEVVTSWPEDVKDMLKEQVMKVACEFLGGQSESDIYDWDNTQDPHDLFDAIVPRFTNYFHHTIKNLDRSTSLYLILFGGTLECVMGAFLWPKMHTGYTHRITALQRLVYKIQLAIFQVAEAVNGREVEKEFEERRREFASKDAHKENDADLAPAEKMRVFRNALNSRNQVGWIFYDGKHRTEQILISNRGLERIQRLFELNADLTPKELLRVMDGCMEAYRNQPAPPKQFRHAVRWQARHGRKLEMFASYLSTIVKQLGMESPVKTYLNDTPSEAEQEEPEPECALAA